jgi:hypothetical protein
MNLGVELKGCRVLSLKPCQLYIPDPSVQVLASFFMRHARFGQKGKIGCFFIGTAISFPGFHDALPKLLLILFGQHTDVACLTFINTSTIWVIFPGICANSY